MLKSKKKEVVAETASSSESKNKNLAAGSDGRGEFSQYSEEQSTGTDISRIILF